MRLDIRSVKVPDPRIKMCSPAEHGGKSVCAVVYFETERLFTCGVEHGLLGSQILRMNDTGVGV